MRYAFFLAFLTFSLSGFCSDSTTVADSVKPHSVKKATILSAALPGAGQIYNHLAMPKGKKKAYWKLPLIYGWLAGTGYFTISHHLTVMDLRDQYRAIEAGGTATGIWSVYGADKTSILLLHDQYARWRDFCIIGFIGVYALQIVDAAVEAHFVNFDVSEDLSLHLSPAFLTNKTAGLKLSLNFR